MDRKKLFKIICIILIVLILIGIGTVLLLKRSGKNKKEDKDMYIEEYTPKEEITNEQIRQTIVTLYFNQKETNTLMPEARLIDAKLLTENPYVTLINLLISEPKNDKLESCIPEGTTVIGAELKNDVVYLNLSNEFISKHIGGEGKERQTIDAIVNTLTELNEVNAVRILIDGEENLCFQDNIINFAENFKKNE